jgi:iron complex outermembrane receptor protein
LWRPREWVSLYGNLAENWGPSNGDLESPTQLVPPTSALQREIGAKFDLLGGRLSSTIALYDLTKTNIPEQNPANPNFYIVTGEVRSRGVELDIQGELRPGWNIILNYSNDDAQVINSTDPNNPVGTHWWEASRNSANLWTTYDFAPRAVQGWRVGGGINYQGVQPPMNYTGAAPLRASDYAQVQSRTLVDLMAAYRLQVQRAKVSMQLNVTNVLNRRYFSYIFLNNPGLGTTYTYAGQTYGFDYRLYGDPRLITGSLKVEF